MSVVLLNIAHIAVVIAAHNLHLRWKTVFFLYTEPA